MLQPGEDGSCIKNISVATTKYAVDNAKPGYLHYYHATSQHGDHLWVAIPPDSYIIVGVAAWDKSTDCEDVVLDMMRSLQQSTA